MRQGTKLQAENKIKEVLQQQTWDATFARGKERAWKVQSLLDCLVKDLQKAWTVTINTKISEKDLTGWYGS